MKSCPRPLTAGPAEPVPTDENPPLSCEEEQTEGTPHRIFYTVAGMPRAGGGGVSSGEVNIDRRGPREGTLAAFTNWSLGDLKVGDGSVPWVPTIFVQLVWLNGVTGWDCVAGRQSGWDIRTLRAQENMYCTAQNRIPWSRQNATVARRVSHTRTLYSSNLYCPFGTQFVFAPNVVATGILVNESNNPRAFLYYRFRVGSSGREELRFTELGP